MKLSKNIHFLASRLSDTPAHQRGKVIDELTLPVLNFIKKKIVGQPLIKSLRAAPNGVKIEINPFWTQRPLTKPHLNIPIFIRKQIRMIEKDVKLEDKMSGNSYWIVFKDMGKEDIKSLAAKLKTNLEKLEAPDIDKIDKDKYGFSIRLKNSPLLREHFFKEVVFRIIYLEAKQGFLGEDFKSYEIYKSLRDNLIFQFHDPDLRKKVKEEKVDEEGQIAQILGDLGANVNFPSGSNEGTLENVPTKVNLKKNRSEIRFIGPHFSVFNYRGSLDSLMENEPLVKKFLNFWKKFGGLKRIPEEHFRDLGKRVNQPSSVLLEDEEFDEEPVSIPENEYETVMDRAIRFIDELGFEPFSDISYSKDGLQLWFTRGSFLSDTKGNYLMFNLTLNPNVNNIILQEAYNLMRLLS